MDCCCFVTTTVFLLLSHGPVNQIVGEFFQPNLTFCMLIETRLLTCRRVLQGNWKSNCFRGKIKERGRPSKAIVHTPTLWQKLYSFSQRKKMSTRSLSHLCPYIILFLFDPVSSLSLSGSPKSFPLLLFFLFLLLLLTSPLFLSSSRTRARAKQVQGTQVWRLCKQRIPGADQKFLLCPTLRCLSTFQYIINLQFHFN